MKIGVFSANIGNVDYSHTLVEQSVPCTYKQFKKKIKDMSPRKSTKRYKTAGLANQRVDIAIWIDGRVNVTSPDFVKFCIESLGKNHFAVPYHPDRKTLKEEYDYILANIHSEYLSVRYGEEDWESEMAAFKNHESAVLVAPRIFVVDLRVKSAVKLLNWWWELIEKYTVFDQTQLTYILDKDKRAKISYMKWNDLNNYVEIVKHRQLK